MAERNVSVKLSANVSSYLTAMAKAKAATTGLSDSSASLTRLGGTLQQVGKMATIGVTLPLLAVGAGAVSMAAKFDTAFAQMVGLANVPAAEVDALKESVLALAGETAVAPQELAEGLYFAASAGLDASAAMDVVEMSARASAAGMGTTADVVNLVSGALAAYGEDNLSAAQATDILTAAIREGKAEPSEFAKALGRVTPIAASMGIGFNEVAGAAAFMSNIIGDTDETITALRGALLAMLDPSVQGRKTLEDMGTSYAELKAAISQDGLLGALDLLREHGFAENSEAMSNLFEDNRALVGATILLEDASGDLVPTIDAVTNSAGSAGEAFSAVADTDGFKMKQALTDIKVAMIQVGDVLLPIAADIASAIGGLVGWFSDLSPAVQAAVVAMAGLAAAAGPVLFIAGSMIKNWQAVSTAFANAGGAASKMGKALGVIGLVAAVAFVGYQAFTAEQKKTDQVTRDVSSALLLQMSALFAAGDAAGFASTEIDSVALANEALSLALADGYEGLGTALADLNVGAENTMTILAQLGNDPVMAIDNLARSFGFTAEEASHLVGISFDSFGVWRGQAERLNGEFGISQEKFLAFGDAVQQLQFAFDNVDVQDIAREFLNAQVEAHGFSGSLVEAAEAASGQQRQTGDALTVLYAWTQQVALADDATREGVLASDEYQAALAGLPPELQAVMSGTEDLTGATEELATVQASSIDTMSQQQDYLSDLEHTLSEYSSGLDTALGHGGAWVRQHYDMAKAFREFSDGITDGDGEIDLLTQGLDANTEAGYNNAQTVLDMADGIIAMTDANIMAGKSQEEVTAEYDAARTALIDAGMAAGLSEEAVTNLINTYGLVPTLVTTAMQIANDALMKWRIDRYLEKLDEVPEEVAVALEAAIDDNDWAEANRIINEVTADQTVNIYANPIGFSGLGGRGWSVFHHALGAYIPQPEIAVLHGNEAVLPLGNAARMRQLVADPRIGDPLMAAMSQVGSGVSVALGRLTPYSAPLMSGTAVGGTPVSSSVMNVVVQMPPGSDGDDVVRALKKWQRRSGPLPLAVR